MWRRADLQRIEYRCNKLIDLKCNDDIISLVAQVILTAAAQNEFDDLPTVIQKRVIDITIRLAKWPAVSGVKALRGNLHGSYRVRTGDYRVVFTVSADDEVVTIWKIANRGAVYE